MGFWVAFWKILYLIDGAGCVPADERVPFRVCLTQGCSLGNERFPMGFDCNLTALRVHERQAKLSEHMPLVVIVTSRLQLPCIDPRPVIVPIHYDL